MSGKIIIIGASRGPGRLLFDKLSHEEQPVLGIARERRGLVTTPTASFIECDATDSDHLAELIGENNAVVNVSGPEILTSLLQRKPAISRLIAIGSTRVYTRFPDKKCSRLAAMSQAVWMQDIPSTILHPTMIYGAPGLNNIERIFRIARLSPLIPLPSDGSALIQPVHVNNVVACIEASLINPETIGRTIVVAGMHAVTYREFIETCIEISENKCRIISLPYFLISLIGLLTHLVPGIPTVTQNEIRRLQEDKSFDITDLEERLGVRPYPLREGLKLAIN